MFEPAYSSQGGAPLGYRCRVLIPSKKMDALRFCGKLCKTYSGMQKHALAKHGMRIQLEMFEPEEVQATANKLLDGDNDGEKVREATKHESLPRSAERAEGGLPFGSES